MSRIDTEEHTSAGGVAFRRSENQIDVALISVGQANRWQLPKGNVDAGESNEEAALREVREEAGIHTRLIDLIEKIEYWFYGGTGSKRTRFHKYVYFYLLEYISGDVNDHDHEVNEARWVEIKQAHDMLAFESERKLVAAAMPKIREFSGEE